MLTQELKKEIQTAYSQFLENKSLKPRYGQKLMVAEIAKCLGAIEMDAEGHRLNDAGICALEAGTGTGKTVAYAIAAIPIAKALKKKVVISTATIALQEQILQRDLPDILRHSGLDFKFALAKGRGRYLCLSRLDQHLNSDTQQETLFGFDTESQAGSSDSVKLYESMAKSLLTSDWNGDRDSWPEELNDEDWSPLTVDRNQCSGRRCQHVSQCSFIKARENLGAVDVIVANHDLVMADLALGGGAILPATEETIFIFDEAHHLPDVALRHFTGQLRVNGSLSWFDQCQKIINDIIGSFPSYVQLLDRLEPLPALLVEMKSIYSQVKPIVESLVEPLIEDFTDQYQLPHYRFEKGQIPPVLEDTAKLLVQRFGAFLDDAFAAHDIVSEALDGDSRHVNLSQAEQLYASLGSIVNYAERQLGVWLAYSRETNEMPDSRWIQIVESGGLLDFELSTSPMLAAGTLTHSLWKPCFGAVLTSATLSALGAFDRLRMFSGLPAFAQTAILPSPFDYANKACFIVPGLSNDPGNHLGHSEEIADMLSDLVKLDKGCLVLFASRRQLNDVYEMVDAELQDIILCQNNMSKQLLIEEHKSRIDNGLQSIIFGLASFAEGIDLPGKYCTHVIIAKLPFSVPNDPIESALAEWLESQGKNPFMEVSLPEASQRLIQACGRLIRTETDEGKITLLDKRILTKRYGRQLLEALPPFARQLANG